MQHPVEIAEVQAHLVGWLKVVTPGDEILITQNGEEVGTFLLLAGGRVPSLTLPRRK